LFCSDFFFGIWIQKRANPSNRSYLSRALPALLRHWQDHHLPSVKSRNNGVTCDGYGAPMAEEHQTETCRCTECGGSGRVLRMVTIQVPVGKEECQTCRGERKFVTGLNGPYPTQVSRSVYSMRHMGSHFPRSHDFWRTLCLWDFRGGLPDGSGVGHIRRESSYHRIGQIVIFGLFLVVVIYHPGAPALQELQALLSGCFHLTFSSELNC